MVELKKRIVAEQDRQKRQAWHEQYRGEGREFLTANAKKEGRHPAERLAVQDPARRDRKGPQPGRDGHGAVSRHPDRWQRIRQLLS